MARGGRGDAGSSSDDEDGGQQQPEQQQPLGSGKARAPNRHRYKNLAERIDDVELGVYRRVSKVSSTPASAAASFTQEALQEWRELNTVNHWLDVERALRPLTASLALLLHHKSKVVATLLAGLDPTQGPALAPVFAVLAALARDLQGEMVPHLPDVWARFTWLLSPAPAGGGGCASEPDVLSALFNTAAALCKALVGALTAALPQTLKHTAGLRYHSEHHVRVLAAEAFGFLLRAAKPRRALRAGLRALLAEAAVRPRPERLHGAGLLCAEAVLGPEHGLHSRTPVLLGLLLQDDILSAQDFGAAADKAAAAAAAAAASGGTAAAEAAAGPSSTRRTRKTAAGAGDAEPDAAAQPEEGAAAAKPPAGPKSLSEEAIRVRCAAVAAIALERLWQHTRRGTTDAIWEVLAAATDRRLAAAEAAAVTAPGAEPAAKGGRKTRRQSDQGQPQPGSQQQQQQDLQACVAHAARAVLLVAHGVHYFRGSRVEDYTPLCTLADRLVSLLQQLPTAAAAATDSGAAVQVQLQRRQSSPSEPISWTADELAVLTLSHSTLQLILGITLGHTKEVGASKGLGVLKAPAQRWSRVLGCVPQRELLAFTQGCVLPPSSAATAELFAPQLLGALGQLLLAAPGADGSSSSSSDGGADLALAGLMEVCGLLRPAAAVGSNDLPLLLTAQPGGTDLAAAVQRLAAGCSSSLSGTGSRQQLLVSWAALQLLPHAAVEPRQALEVCSAVVAAATAAAAAAAASNQPGTAGQRGDAVSSSDLLQLRGLAAGMLAALLPSIAPQQLPQQAAEALQWILTAPGSGDSWRLDLSTVSAAALLAEALRSYVDSAGKAHSSDGSSNAEAAATAAAVTAGRALLSSEQLPAFATALLPCLVQPQQSLRAAALRLLCSFDQPAFLGHHQQQAQQEQERAAFEGMACDVLCVLRDMHTQPCSIQAGRTWAVALERTCNHLEYGRLPPVLLPCLTAGLIGVMHIRFSPLWQPAAKALGEALNQHHASAWPIICDHLAAAQQQFLSGSSSGSSGGGGGADSRSSNGGGGSFDLQQQWASFCEHGCSSMAARGSSSSGATFGGCTDPANRLTQLLKGLAAQASAGSLEKAGPDWVPLLLALATAVTHNDMGPSGAAGADDDADADAEAAAGVEEEEGGAAPAAAAVEGSSEQAITAAGSKRKQPEQQQRFNKRQRSASGLAVALNRDGLGGLGFSVRGWRGVMMEWLALLAASKAAKRLSRSAELQEAVTRQLLSTDAALQAAALRCMATFKLPFLPQPLQAVLLQLADNAQLRACLMNIPMMFDRGLTAEQQQRAQEQTQRAVTSGVAAAAAEAAAGGSGGAGKQAKAKKKGGGREVVRVDDAIRPGFVPLLTLVLYPKLAKRSGRLGGKGAPGSARAAVLNSMAALEPGELVPLLELMLMPLASCFKQQQGGAVPANTDAEAVAAEAAAVAACRLIPAPWWSSQLVNGSLEWWLAAVERASLAAQPLRRRQGFLNAFEDMLQHLGFRFQVLLPPMLAITMHLLTSACAGLQQQQGGDGAAAAGASREEGRAVRSQCLRLLAQVFSRFPAALDFNPLWPAFFEAAAPLMPRLLPEAAAVQPPPLLAAAAALAAAPGLARVLGNLPSVQQQAPADESSAMQVDQGSAAAVEPLTWPEGCSQPAWAAQGLGGELLSACFAALSARGCSEGSRDAALSVAEACLELQPPQLLGAVLLPWTGQLLGDLRASIEGVLTAAAVAGGSGGRTRGGGRSGGKGQFHRPQRPSVIRQLALLEQLGPHCSDAGAAASLAAALVSLLQPPRNSRSGGSSAARAGGSGGFKRAPLDERGLARALAALTALWKAQKAAGGSQPAAAAGASVAVLQQQWEVVSLLLGHLSRRESRTAAAVAMGSLGSLMDASTSTSSSGGSERETYAAVAALLTALNSWSAATLDEPDYNARLAAYAELQQALWQRCGRLAALPLLLQAFFDARNEGDLALRQAAASALTRAVRAFATLDAASREQQQQAAADAAAMQVDAPPGGGSTAAAADDPLRLLPRVVYPQIKVGLRCASLAVRQEHAALIRDLVLLLPGRFQDLLPLCSTDAEQDFFLNITHLQIHRRGRALQLLARLVSAQQQQQQQQQQGGGDGSSPAAAEDADAAAAAAPAKKRRKLQAGEAAAADAQEEEEQQADDSQQQQQQHKPVSARVLLDIAAPLLQQFIFEGAGGSADSLAARGASDAADAAAANRGGHGKKAGDSDREGAVAASAVAALGALAGQLGWHQYSGLLQRWMRLMEQYPRKLIIRAACAVLDAFHFPLDEGGGDGEQEQLEGAAAGSGRRGSKAAASQQQQQSQQGGEEAGGDDDAASEGEAVADDDEAATAAAAAAAEDAAAVAVAARHLLHAKVLPALQSQLVVDDKEVARAPVALAIVKVIKLLPAEVERVALPRALTAIAGLLRSRLPSSRDEAREVLADVSLELGPEYLPTVMKVLRAVLPDKGYTAHVLGYTAATLLAAHVKAGVAPGTLDACVELLLPTLEGDLFGEVSEAKEATAFASKHKEAKRCRANEAYQNLAAAVTFGSSSSDRNPFDALLQLVRDKLPAAGSPSVRAKLEQLLAAAARGLSQNPSVQPQALAAWLGIQLDACLSVEEAARAKAKAAVGAAVSTAAPGGRTGSAAAAATAAAVAAGLKADLADGGAAAAQDGAAGGSGGVSPEGSAHLYLLSYFCVSVLSTSMKKGRLAGRDPASLTLLDPLLPLLVRGLASRHMGTVQASLKCLTLLVAVQQLPGMPAAAVGAGRAVAALLRKVPDAAHPLAQDCFKLLGAMLRDCPSYEPATGQIRFLLKWIAADLQSPSGTSASAMSARVGGSGGGTTSTSAGDRVSGYSLLRAVLGRKLMLPEVYDVMDIVQQQMITSHLPPVRSTAASALLQFLLDYPLSPGRLQGHLLFLLTNTGYEHEEGRLQALEMLQQVFLKFPPDVVANFSTTAYMPLVTRLANETSPKARTTTAATIKLLHQQLQQDANDALAALSQQWLFGSLGGGGAGGGSSPQQRHLRAVAAQALGLLAETEGQRFGRRLSAEAVQGLTRVLESGAAAAETMLLSRAQQQAGDGEDGGGEQQQQQQHGSDSPLVWQEPYHVLLLLEKAARGGVAPLQWAQGADVQGLWGLIVREMLLYPHLWVRKAAARLLGIALANSSIHSGLLGLAAAEEAGAAAGAAAAASGSSNSSSVSVSAGRCALLVYLQLEADVADEGLCTQAVKCLVALAKHLAAAQPPEPEQQQAAANGNGEAAADGAAAANGHAAADGSSGGGSESEDEDEEEDEEAAAAENAADGDEEDVSGHAEPGGAGVTLLGLISRMVRLAEDARFIRQEQRLAALRWIAAAVSAVGTAPLARYLPLLLRPLYRITEASGEARVRAQASKHGGLTATAAGGGGGVPEDVAVLADQVLGHLREQFGADALLAAYASAREGVRAHRSARKTAAARRVLLDPEAAARLKVRRGKKKTQARHRKAEERRRVRSARTSGGFGPAKGSGAGRARGGVSKPAAGGGYGGGGGGRAHKKRGG